MKKVIINIFVFIFTLLPVLVFAVDPPPSSGLIPCDGPNCDFSSFMSLINNVVNFIFVYLVVPLCAVMFAYGGFLLLTGGGNPESMTKVKHILGNSALGLIIAGISFLIVKLLLSILGYDGSWIGF